MLNYLLSVNWKCDSYVILNFVIIFLYLILILNCDLEEPTQVPDLSARPSTVALNNEVIDIFNLCTIICMQQVDKWYEINK